MIRQAITTTYKGPTNHRGARIVARAQAGSITVPYAYDSEIAENHVAAAKALQAKWEWAGSLVTGVNHDGDYVHVLVQA